MKRIGKSLCSGFYLCFTQCPSFSGLGVVNILQTSFWSKFFYSLSGFPHQREFLHLSKDQHPGAACGWWKFPNWWCKSHALICLLCSLLTQTECCFKTPLFLLLFTSLVQSSNLEKWFSFQEPEARRFH